MLTSKLSSLIFMGKTHWGESLTVVLRIFEVEKENTVFSACIWEVFLDLIFKTINISG